MDTDESGKGFWPAIMAGCAAMVRFVFGYASSQRDKVNSELLEAVKVMQSRIYSQDAKIFKLEVEVEELAKAKRKLEEENLSLRAELAELRFRQERDEA